MTYMNLETEKTKVKLKGKPKIVKFEPISDCQQCQLVHHVGASCGTVSNSHQVNQGRFKFIIITELGSAHLHTFLVHKYLNFMGGPVGALFSHFGCSRN